jgi:DNA-binding MarR family transcriptional regulator
MKKKSDSTVLEELYARPGYLVRRCHQVSTGIFHQCFKELNLTPIQYSSLFVLKHNPGLDQVTISGLVAIDKSTTGNVLKRLESRGLLQRKSSAEDGRIKLIYLTRKGHSLMDKTEKLLDKTQQLLIEPLNEKERVQLMHCLRKITTEHNQSSRAPLMMKQD